MARELPEVPGYGRDLWRDETSGTSPVVPGVGFGFGISPEVSDHSPEAPEDLPEQVASLLKLPGRLPESSSPDKGFRRRGPQDNNMPEFRGNGRSNESAVGPDAWCK